GAMVARSPGASAGGVRGRAGPAGEPARPGTGRRDRRAAAVAGPPGRRVADPFPRVRLGIADGAFAVWPGPEPRQPAGAALGRVGRRPAAPDSRARPDAEPHGGLHPGLSGLAVAAVDRRGG